MYILRPCTVGLDSEILCTTLESNVKSLKPCTCSGSELKYERINVSQSLRDSKLQRIILVTMKQGGVSQFAITQGPLRSRQTKGTQYGTTCRI